MSKILVTGGAGYIGSFIVRKLKEDGHEVVIVDNLSQGNVQAIEGFRFEKIDLVSEGEKLKELLVQEKFDGVIHMASYIQAGESMKNPYKYFQNNLIGAMNLLDGMVSAGTKKLVLSSTAAVYGTPQTTPIEEDFPKQPENTYGETKLMIERMLHWFDIAHGVKYICIRYFNAAGAALDGGIGEDHPQESHIIPLALNAAINKKPFIINGSDYSTPDGTCIRDYIHVLDLASAHSLAVKALLDGCDSNYFNAGSGIGYSNKQIVDGIKALVGEFEVTYGDKRPGDPAVLTASNTKIKNILGWEAKHDLTDILKSAYLWHTKHPHGYQDR